MSVGLFQLGLGDYNLKLSFHKKQCYNCGQILYIYEHVKYPYNCLQLQYSVLEGI